ncbi:hypothetical protein I4U23_024962 [Adineta vaga]|nr:hypothetical protein I4U23_024962 [Adineta vaga]
MFRYLLTHQNSRWSCSFLYSHFSNNRLKNFDQNTFDYFYTRRLKFFNDNHKQMSDHLHTQLKSLLKTSSIHNHLIHLNSTKHFSENLTIEQLNDILFYAYKHQIKLDLLTKRLIECLNPIEKNSSSNLFIEFVNLLVLHQQKYYDYQTKAPNKTLDKLLQTFEFNLTKDQIKNISLSDLSLLCSAMYRLQISLKNHQLLESIGEYLIEDEKKKNLSAVDKQNFIKIITLSNYGKIEIANALANRFNQSFEQHLQSNLNSFSYEIVRMTMRIGFYFSMIRFYSERFFQNCLKLIELEAKISAPSYRVKDIVQIMNTLIFMGYVKTCDRNYMNLIDRYDQIKHFEEKPERLLDVIPSLAIVEHFPDNLLEKLYTKDNLNRLLESRMKEKLFFVSESYKLLCSPSKALLDQNYLVGLPHHLFGSWSIEKRKRSYFSIVMKHLSECVPDRSYVKSAFLLKHFKIPDIIICLNTNQQPQIISNESNCSKYALEVLSEEELCVNEPFRPLGLFYSKARQLQKMNYIPVIIYPHDTLHEIKTRKEVFEWIVHRAQTTELLLKKN